MIHNGISAALLMLSLTMAIIAGAVYAILDVCSWLKKRGDRKMHKASKHDEAIMERAQADARSHFHSGRGPQDTPAGMSHGDAHVYRKWYVLTMRQVRELDEEDAKCKTD